jgi:tRNA-guanine family transglycosylase
MVSVSEFKTKSSGLAVRLPLFIPVYRPDFSFELFDADTQSYGLNAVMVNSFLLYRDAALRKSFERGRTLREHIGEFKGLLCTDSGAFQQLSGRRVDLDALEIVRFQNIIQTDIAAPLDLLTPPETSYDETVARMRISQYRIEEAAGICGYSDLAAIQQGGGYFSLRRKHIRQLADIGFSYYGIGSMVPFFNKNHDLAFTCKVIQDAREVIGQVAPMHIYGAGDPLDIVFMYYAGANIFDSSSYAHYAKLGYYMTAYGAVNKRAMLEKLGFVCSCPVCAAYGLADVFDEKNRERLLKRHNLFTILDTIRVLSELGASDLDKYVSRVYGVHTANSDIFPNSRLASSWERFLDSKPIENASESRRDKVIFHIGERNGAIADEKLSDAETLLLESLAEEIAAAYKMERLLIYGLLKEEYALPRNAGFRSRVLGIASLKDVFRLSGYKVFRKNIRARLYQSLRQYKPNRNNLEALAAELISGDNPGRLENVLEQILGEHVSAKERLADRQNFTDVLRRVIPDGSVVADIGCGFNPLLISAEFYNNLSSYIALDKDTQSVEMVRIYAKKYGIDNLKAYTWDIGGGFSELEKITGISHFDAALALKIIPALYRADHTRGNSGSGYTIPIIGRFPASVMLATVCRESMTRRENIEKRELASLRRFTDEYGFTIESEVSFRNEFGFVLRKAGK